MHLPELIKEARKFVETNRDNLPLNLYSILSKEAFAREFCTLHINPGRRTGKGTFIRNNASNRDLIIVANEILRRDYLYISSSKVITISDLERLEYPSTVRFCECGVLVSKVYNTIYIDEPRLCFSNDRVPIEKVYRLFAHSHNQMFILLGE